MIPQETETTAETPAEDALPFKFLGFEPDQKRKGKHKLYFLSNGAVVVIPSTKIKKPNLFWIASPAWWEKKFGNRYRVEWDAAKSWLIHSSYRAGIYQAT